MCGCAEASPVSLDPACSGGQPAPCDLAPQVHELSRPLEPGMQTRSAAQGFPRPLVLYLLKSRRRSLYRPPTRHQEPGLALDRERNDKRWMRRALRQARRGWGRTTPNPLVGAVIVRDGHEVGAGFHRRAGTPHAEAHALAAAGGNARGATLYVTLEPCSTTGRTPPCTDAILEAGVARVVIGCLDPNPNHAGGSVSILSEHGVEADVGVEQEECERLNEAFFCWIQHGRPFVLLKMAMTLDGKIATAGGQSKWITGPKARRHVQRLRQWTDAIMVGAETVRQDDPSLTVRAPRNWWRQPRKLVWTREPSLARHHAIWGEPPLPPEFVGPQSRAEWLALLQRLGRQEVTALLVEGGGELAAACLRAGIVDKVAFFVAPKVLGGRDSRPVVGGGTVASLAEALPVRDLTTRRIGNDLLITGYVTDVHRAD